MSSPPKLKVTGIKPIWQSPYKHETNINKSFESNLIGQLWSQNRFWLVNSDWSIPCYRIEQYNKKLKKHTPQQHTSSKQSAWIFWIYQSQILQLKMSFLIGCQMSGETLLVDLKTILSSRERQIRNKALIFDRHLDQDFHFYPDLLPQAPVFLRSNIVLLVLRSLLWLTIPYKTTSQNHIDICRGSYSTISW